MHFVLTENESCSGWSTWPKQKEAVTKKMTYTFVVFYTANWRKVYSFNCLVIQNWILDYLGYSCIFNASILATMYII